MLTARAMVAAYLVARTIVSMIKISVRHGEYKVEDLDIIDVFGALALFAGLTAAWIFVLSGYPPRGFLPIFVVIVQSCLFFFSIMLMLYKAEKYGFMELRQSAPFTIVITGLQFLIFYWSGLVRPIFELLERIELWK